MWPWMAVASSAYSLACVTSAASRLARKLQASSGKNGQASKFCVDSSALGWARHFATAHWALTGRSGNSPRGATNVELVRRLRQSVRDLEL